MFGGDFAVEVNGQPVLNERERGHMADVRTVFRGLWILAIVSVVVLVAASRRADRGRTWRAVRGGAIGLSVGVVIAGVVGFFAFDQLFELFHTIFFPAGSYLFDPLTDRLVQLFPFAFWYETAMVVGAVIIGVSLVVAFVAGRRAAAHRAPEPAAGPGGDAGTRLVSAPPAAGLLSVEAARDAVLAVTEPVGTEPIIPADALGRITAEAVVGRVSLPPWPNSAMDGYAIRAADTAAATEDDPVELRVIGDIAAGAAPERHGRARNGRPHRDRRTPPRRRRCRRPGRADDAARRGGPAGPARSRRDRARAERLPGPRAGRARRLGPRGRERPQGRRDPPASRAPRSPRRP